MSKGQEVTGKQVQAASAGAFRHRFGQQIDGGWNIAIWTKDKTSLIAQIVTTTKDALTINAAPGSRFGNNTNPPQSKELWWYQSSQLSTIPQAIHIESNRIENGSVTLLSQSFDPNNADFSSEESAGWEPYHVRSATDAFSGHDQNNNDRTLYLRIVASTTGTITKVKWFAETLAADQLVVPETGDWDLVSIPHTTYEAAYSLGAPDAVQGA